MPYPKMPKPVVVTYHHKPLYRDDTLAEWAESQGNRCPEVEENPLAFFVGLGNAVAITIVAAGVVAGAWLLFRLVR